MEFTVSHLFFQTPILKIHCLLFLVPWEADHWGTHRPGYLAPWLPFGFDHRRGQRRHDPGVRVFLPPSPSCIVIAGLAVVASLHNYSFCQKALLPWLQLFLGSNNMFSLLAFVLWVV